jgi:hypothetical protein
MQGDRKGALFVGLRSRLGAHLRTKSFPSPYQYLCQFLDGADKIYQSSLRRCVHQPNFDFFSMSIDSFIFQLEIGFWSRIVDK